MAQSQNKLVGTQYLDLSRLRNDVAETNKLLQSIGAGVNLNMTDVVQKQVRQILQQFQKEIQQAAAHGSKAGQQMGAGLQGANSQIQQLLTTTQKLSKDGSLIETQKGYDQLGNAITEVYKNGQLLNRSLKSDSAFTKDLAEANRMYQEQIDLVRKLYAMKTQRLKTEDGTLTATDLDKQIKATEKQITGNERLISLLDQQAVKQSNLAKLAKERAELESKYNSAVLAQQDQKNAQAKAEADLAASGANELKSVQQAYKQLTNSYRQYNIAVKNSNEAGQTYWSQSAAQAMNEINLVEQKLGTLNIEEGTRKKILDLIHQAKNAEATHQKQLESTGGQLSQLDQTLDKIGSRILQMATTMLVLRGISTIWQNATDYAQQYYDRMNEIRIVSGKSQTEINRQGVSYRSMAKEMNVASTEIATAAVEFWRQGLPEDEVNRRLKSTIQYAKISGLEFDEAAELITAATNTMEVSAKRAADVFAYLGDASASGADEIGVAMQKASASAVEFGLSFEWLGAYIATISEKTRQAPEVIGTSINSIMARLHSIKAKGYNEDDATQINDVAKALSTIDVALMDNEGNWRSMSDIFDDIADRWGTLDSKTRSYIATTMAGTRQQNYFIALMNDMALGIEGGSRAYELYAGALNAAGTAAQKYSVWQESVTAAQNRLTAALESFYSLLDAEWMKVFYDGMAGLVEIITAGTDALGGWNILIPLIVVGITGLIAVIYKAVVAIKTMMAAMAGGATFATAMTGGAFAAIAAIGAAIAALVTVIAGAASSSVEIEKIDYSTTIESMTSYRENIDELVSELEDLASKTTLTADEQKRADEIMTILSGTSLSMKAALEGGAEGFDTLGERAAAARGEVERTDQAIRSLNASEALQNLRDSDNAYSDAISDAQGDLTSASQYGAIADAYEAYMAANPSGMYQKFEYTPGSMGGGTYVDRNFMVYARDKANKRVPWTGSDEAKQAAREEIAFWQSVVAELEQLGIDGSTAADVIANKMLEFDIAGQTYAEANRESLAEAWQPVFDDLYAVMTDGTQFSQLPSFMQDAAVRYYEAYIGGIDQQAELAEGDLMAMAADLTSVVDGMFKHFSQDADFSGLVEQFDDLLDGPLTQETVDELNALIPLINEFIATYNGITETTDDDIPLFEEFTLEGLQEAQAEIEATGEAIASLDTADLYKDLAIAREEASRFGSVLSKLGEGEDQFQNIHDAVLATAEEIAAGLGITDSKAIGEIGDTLLEGLYDTYPGIADYVDTSTGMLLDGWQDAVANATNPWAEIFEEMRLEDALEDAKKDMAALDVSELWAELLNPDGMGLYQYAENWARQLLPDGTEEEIIALASQFVEVFFEMFDEIDTTILDADGRIEAGMENVVDTIREKVYEAEREASKLETAYESVNADRIARNDAVAGLTTMAGLAQSGDAAGVGAAFEEISTEGINAIIDVMPELIDKLHDGTYTAEDFYEAIRLVNEAAVETGKTAWDDYMSGTADGARVETTALKAAMREVITEVSVAEDKTAAFYAVLQRLSGEGVDISAMLEQFGSLGYLLMSDTANADELYESLNRLGDLQFLQLDLEEADALSNAAKAIDPSNSSYDPLAALEAYALLEAEYTELTALQRGSAEYIAEAKRLTVETTAAVYEQAAAYGVVTDIQAKAAQYALQRHRERRFDTAEENSYAGGIAYLEEAVRTAEENGEDVAQAWNDALADLDEAGILEGMIGMFGDISNLAVACGGDVAQIVEELYAMQDAAQAISLSDMATSLREERNANFAETGSYGDQIGMLTEAFGDGGAEGVAAAMEVWNSFDSSLQQSIAETYPSLIMALDDANRAAGNLGETMSDLEATEEDMADASKDADKQIGKLSKELSSAQRSASSRYFKNTSKAIEELRNGTMDAAEAFDEYNKEAEAAAEANEQYQKANKKMASGMEVTADEIDVLTSYLGNIDPNILLANWDMVGPMIASALAEGEDAFHRLNEAAFITITGTSVADFSALTSGLISVQNLAADAVAALIATGQWTTETITLPQEGALWDPVSGTWTTTTLNTNQTVLRYTGSNPLRSGGSTGSGSSGGGKSGGGGGGGGGSSNTEVSKSIQKMLDKMDEEQGFEDHYRRMAQLAQGYHEARGEIQGVILYLEKEKDLVADNTDTLRGYVDTLEAQIEKKQGELSKYKEGSKKYKQAMVDLEALQEAHQQYSEQLLENMTDLEDLQNQIDEWHDTVREMEIDLRELIHEAIMDREELNRRMLEGRIDLENELIDVLTQRYETERDELLELAELKKEALNEELAMLDEQLEVRKKLAEQEDRAAELAEKEAQLARISADPTRKKEELALREEIAELREELAWELAEQEVDAQKKSIESQIDSIDEYMEYVEIYYNELLSNPRKLIEEMQELLTRTDEEILAWLQANHEEYQKSTDATREDMRLGWKEMLDDMRGNTVTYWDEVEDIISQGDDAIIEFLKENSADYREAGKLQAEAYVDEWRKQLEELKKALESVSSSASSTKYTSTSSSKSSSSGGSSSKSSGSSSSTTTTKQFVASGTGYAEASKSSAQTVTYNGTTYVKDPNSSYWYNRSDAKLIDGGRTLYWKTGTTRYVKKYLEGGLATGTGLAWVDGTTQRPERILSPYQTELFEDLIRSLHEIRTLRAPTSVVTPHLPEAQTPSYHIDSITVQVQRLESEQDYEEMAERVGEHIMDKVTRGMSVGGIRIG